MAWTISAKNGLAMLGTMSPIDRGLAQPEASRRNIGPVTELLDGLFNLERVSSLTFALPVSSLRPCWAQPQRDGPRP